MTESNNMKMIKNIALTLAAAGLTAITAQAAPIVGQITISGGADLNSNNLGLATQVDAWVTPTVDSFDGSFVGFVALNDPVTMTAPWTFASGAHAGLWSVGGFTFDLISSAVSFQSGTFLAVSGTGTISGNGYDPTVGTFNFTTQEPDASGIFSFSAANGFAGVPDGGSTLVLFGSVIVGLFGIARKSLQNA